MTSLTPQQRKHIQETWAIPAANPTDSGEAILLAYFEKYPKNQENFVSFKDVPLSSLKGHSGLRSHGNRVIAVFQAAISSLSKDDYRKQLELIWSKIGESHKRRNISRQAFNELREVVVGILIEVCKLTDEQKVAWSEFMDIAYDIVFGKLENVTA